MPSKSSSPWRSRPWRSRPWRKRPATAVVALTMLDDGGSVLAMMRAGARGYLLNGAGVDEIACALEAVRLGSTVFGGPVAQFVIDQLVHRRSLLVLFPELTARERAVLETVTGGHKNIDIARQLHLSVQTVRNYLSRIFPLASVDGMTETGTDSGRGTGAHPETWPRVPGVCFGADLMAEHPCLSSLPRHPFNRVPVAPGVQSRTCDPTTWGQLTHDTGLPASQGWWQHNRNLVCDGHRGPAIPSSGR